MDLQNKHINSKYSLGRLHFKKLLLYAYPTGTPSFKKSDDKMKGLPVSFLSGNKGEKYDKSLCVVE